MDFNNCGFIDPQAQLAGALAKQDIRQFVAALDSGALADLQDDRHTSIYEKALSTPGCRDFIEACIDHGSQVNYINKKLDKAAISYAADSRDPGNLAALLKYRPGNKVQVDRKYGQLTPLNSLAKNLTDENAPDVYSCMQLLLDYGASPNIVDQGEFTPLHHVLRKSKVKAGKKELIQLFLDHPELDIDSYRNGEVRRLLQAQFPELKLPEERHTGPEIDIQTLQRTLRDGDETLFEQQFAEYLQNLKGGADNQLNAHQEEYFGLLQESIKRGRQRAFDVILSTGMDINSRPGRANEANLVETAVIYGNWQALERLLKEPNLRLTPDSKLLNAVIGRLDEPPYDGSSHQRCFELLINSDRVDINEADSGRLVPLFFAVKYRNTSAMQKLLKNGAYIGSKSAFGTLPIKDMPPEVLEEHFDSCITTNGERPGDQNFEIIIDYKNLMRQERDSGLNQLQDEMAPIAFIAESKEMRHLLQHPLISSFLFLKWHRLSVIFYLNFLIYSLFTASIITYTLLKFHESDQRALTAFFGLLSWLGISYLILRECIQWIMSPVRYFWSITNIMEVALITLSIFTCMESSFDKETQRVLAVFTILLVSMEFCLLVGSLPVLSISTHMLMLREVSNSFLKSFTLYSIFVLTFSLCFYILFGKSVEEDQSKSATPCPPLGKKEGKDEEQGFNTFTKPIEAVIKTIVMLTGEFDAGSIQFTSIYTYLIFLLFVIFMTIVLFNLLNGLAVSDTQVIKAQAELNGAICRTNVLSRYEQVLTGHGRAGFLLGNHLFRSICQRLMNIYPNYLSLRQISVLPNDGNKVLIPMSDPFEMRTLKKASFQQLPLSAAVPQKKLLDPPLRLLPCCCSLLTGKCSQMSGRVVKRALEVIDQKNAAEQRRKQEQINDSRLKLIEYKLEQLIQLVQDRK
uniref:Transient receptor potential cation channel protein painless n=3 Tax=Drosophila melanogaster TaxID=7227 RepID=PAIN_DROME|nr:painless, isoform A [Drosophila melanogaster]Q9W0Y6.1 RecName: Full=Transient receptor potential cation channel protein painless [Drosophila melanogaster]AAF47293.1 painless, isoform A [Drosophila melanogaster]AAP03646.1 painless [Drosophila melanogaster]AAR99141.1 RE03641p [Drosophila melanogaster]|eukprot:NP_611979.1 painless, isoform A [Drosophila melanogaster]